MSRQQSQEFDRLRGFLALKRHEKPHPGYFANFLDEFHRRQRVEPIRRLGWWGQLVEFFRSEPLLAARYALGSAAVLLLCLNLYLLSNRANPSTPNATASAQPPFSPQPPPAVFAERDTRPMQVASNAQPNATPSYVLDRVNVAPVTYEPSGEF